MTQPPPLPNIVVSFVLSTHNRREVLFGTISNLYRCGLDLHNFEIIVVDNASTDGTAELLKRTFPLVQLLPQSVNRGSCAKNVGLERARGRYVVFLDDDSYPRPDSIERMIRHFEADRRLGAAVFAIHLPDGSRECSAYPDVFIGCGTGFRRRALKEVGGLPEDFFMQAEEYDLSLRLLDAGWKVRRFDDLHVEHLKSSLSRQSRRVMRLDVRNNIVLASRYFPDAWVRPFTVDWLKRYYKLAASRRQRVAFFAGAAQGLVAALRERVHRTPITDDAFESFAKVCEIARRLRKAQEILDLRTIALIDLGKNMLPYWIAARKLGIRVVAVADNKLARRDGKRPRKYRGVPILDDEEAQTWAFDAAVVANLSPVHAELRRNEWRRSDRRLVIDLFEPGLPWSEDATAPDALNVAVA